jgi:SsrA-binding protein
MKTVATNKTAYHNYQILETFEAGIALLGSEVKAIREGRISLKESYAEVKGGDVFLVKCHISPYEAANIFNHEPLRERLLLLHKREIRKLTGKIKERGFTLVPTKVLFNDRACGNTKSGTSSRSGTPTARSGPRSRSASAEQIQEAPGGPGSEGL